MRKTITKFLLLLLIITGCAHTDNARKIETPEKTTPPEEATSQVRTNNLPVPKEGFSWDQLASMASQRTAEAQMAALRIKSSRLEKTLESSVRDPQLRLNSGFATEDEYSKDSNNSHDDIQSYSVGLRFYVNNPFVNRWIRRQAEKSATAIMASANELSYATYCETKSACLEAAILEDRSVQLGDAIKQQKKVCSRYDELIRNGHVAPLKLLKAKLKLSRLQMRKGQVGREHRNALFQISLLTGIPVDRLNIQGLDKQGLPSPDKLSVNELVATALKTRPDLESIRCEAENARMDIEIAKARQIPWFDFVEGSIRDRNADSSSYTSSGVSHSDSDRDEWTLRTGISIPIFSWAGNEIALAKALLREIELREALALSSLHSEITNAIENYTDAYATHNQTRNTTEQQIATFKETINAIDKTRTVLETEIMETEEELISFRREARQSLYDCLRLKLMLESTTGERGEVK